MLLPKLRNIDGKKRNPKTMQPIANWHLKSCFAAVTRRGRNELGTIRGAASPLFGG
jgi:hypothetical protein